MIEGGAFLSFSNNNAYFGLNHSKGLRQMIKTVTIDIINDKAMKLLQDLELLQLIRLHKEEGQPTLVNWVQRYKGAMSKQALTDIDDQLTELRNGWE